MASLHPTCCYCTLLAAKPGVCLLSFTGVCRLLRARASRRGRSSVVTELKRLASAWASQWALGRNGAVLVGSGARAAVVRGEGPKRLLLLLRLAFVSHKNLASLKSTHPGMCMPNALSHSVGHIFFSSQCRS